jgi:hypothetical protein
MFRTGTGEETGGGGVCRPQPPMTTCWPGPRFLACIVTRRRHERAHQQLRSSRLGSHRVGLPEVLSRPRKPPPPGSMTCTACRGSGVDPVYFTNSCRKCGGRR